MIHFYLVLYIHTVIHMLDQSVVKYAHIMSYCCLFVVLIIIIVVPPVHSRSVFFHIHPSQANMCQSILPPPQPVPPFHLPPVLPVNRCVPVVHPSIHSFGIVSFSHHHPLLLFFLITARQLSTTRFSLYTKYHCLPHVFVCLRLSKKKHKSRCEKNKWWKCSLRID